MTNKSKRTYFTLKDLVSFGNYLFSDDRTKNMQAIRREQHNGMASINQVYDADIANWREMNKKVT